MSLGQGANRRRVKRRSFKNKGVSSAPSPYLNDVTTQTSFEVEQTLSVSAPGTKERLHLTKVEVRMAVNGGGDADNFYTVTAGWAYRFGAAAYSSVTSFVSTIRTTAGVKSPCGVSSIDTASQYHSFLTVDVDLLGGLGESLDVQISLRRVLTGSAVIASITSYCVQDGKPTYDVLRESIHGRVVV